MNEHLELTHIISQGLTWQKSTCYIALQYQPRLEVLSNSLIVGRIYFQMVIGSMFHYFFSLSVLAGTTFGSLRLTPR